MRKRATNASGSPLIECRAGGAIVQLFERTGPYLSVPGPGRVILNPTTEALEASEDGSKLFETAGLGRVRAQGMVLAREPAFAVVDAGVPLVVGVHGGVDDGVASGDWVAFESEAPMHGFILPPSRRQRADGERDDEV